MSEFLRRAYWLLSLSVLFVLVACRARVTEELGEAQAALHASCGALTYVGCCEGDHLLYCALGGGDAGASVRRVPCAQEGCGFNPLFGIYTCGGALFEDPGGGAPRACPDADGGEPNALRDGGVAVDAPAQDGASAAVDGAAQDGAPAAVDGAAQDGAPAAVDTAPDDLVRVSCHGISYVGCCSGATLRFCVGGVILTRACGAAASCGWDPARGFYTCGMSGGSDPTGTYLRACPSLFWDGGAVDMSVDRSVPVELGVVDVGRVDARRDVVEDRGRADRGENDTFGRDLPVGLEVVSFDLPVADMQAGPVDEGGCRVGASPKEDAAGVAMALLLLLLGGLRRFLAFALRRP